MITGQKLFCKEARRFMAALHQRQYQWRDKQLEPFWDDVSAKAAEMPDGESKFEHCMGALILPPVEEGSQIARTPRQQVVDGQQRLAALQLFLARCARWRGTMALKT